MGKHIAFGLSLIALAVFLILSSLGYIPYVGTTRLIFTFILGMMVVFGIVKLEPYSFFIPLSFIAMMYKGELNIDSMNNPTIFIIGLLLAIGFSLITRNIRKRRFQSYFEKDRYRYNHGNRDRYSGGRAHFKSYNSLEDLEEDLNSNNFESNTQTNDEIEDDIISHSSTMGSSTRFIKSSNLKKAYLSNELGSLNVYFDDVTVSKDGAEVEVYCTLGEMKLFIPKEFKVICNVKAGLGNVDMDVVPSDIVINTITINGTVELGNLQIIRT